MRTRWDWEFAFERFPEILEGMLITVIATLFGIVIALTLGLVLALGRRAKSKWISYPFAWFIEFVRSTPLLIQLFFLFFALPTIIFPGEITIAMSALVTLIIGLGVHYACYASEAYRAGIDSVPKGQWEAATALNLKTTTTWRQVILPQAIPRSLPTLGNYFVGMFKDAPIGAAIGVGGVLATARSIGAETFRFVEPLVTAGVLFLAISIPAAFFVRYIERKVFYES